MGNERCKNIKWIEIKIDRIEQNQHNKQTIHSTTPH